MWWYAKNGSIKAWLGESSNAPSQPGYKRKSKNDDTGGERKRLKIQRISEKDQPATSFRRIRRIKRSKDNGRKIDSTPKVLAESTNVKDGAPEMRKGKQKSLCGNESKKGDVSESKENESISSISSEDGEKREIIIDDDLAPLSQNLYGFLGLESP